VKITQVEAIFVDRYLFVRVHTDAGITGIGESGAWGFLEASEKAVQKFALYLVGQDPLRTEHHWQYMYRWSHFRGAAIMGAITGGRLLPGVPINITRHFRRYGAVA